jgi:hypothetical protein
MPLSAVLELIHLSRRSGGLLLRTELPHVLGFRGGELVAVQLLDWEGFGALQTLDPHPKQGSFRFEARHPVVEQFRIPFEQLLADWARAYDEWGLAGRWLASPSQVTEVLPGAPAEYARFSPSRSVRGVSRETGSDALTLFRLAAQGVQGGWLRPLSRFTWFGLKVRHPLARGENRQEIPHFLDGRKNLYTLLAQGFSASQLREYLIQAILGDELRFEGAGWVLRDLLWERAWFAKEAD